MKNAKITVIATATVAMAAAHVFAAAILTEASATYSENFSGLKNGGTSTTLIPATDTSLGATIDLAGTEFKVSRFGGTGTSALILSANDGTGSSAAIYSFGTGNSTERALGTIADSANIPAFGLEVKNSGTTAITSFAITGTQENWHQGRPATNVVDFQYATSSPTNGLTAANFLNPATTGFTDYDPLDLSGPAGASAAAALDGNQSANQVAKSGTIVLANQLAP